MILARFLGPGPVPALYPDTQETWGKKIQIPTACPVYCDNDDDDDDDDFNDDDDDFDYAESPVLVISDQYSARPLSYIYSLHAARYNEDDEDDNEDGDADDDDDGIEDDDDFLQGLPLMYIHWPAAQSLG